MQTILPIQDKKQLDKQLALFEGFFSEDSSRRNVGTQLLPSVYCSKHQYWEVQDYQYDDSQYDDFQYEDYQYDDSQYEHYHEDYQCEDYQCEDYHEDSCDDTNIQPHESCQDCQELVDENNVIRSNISYLKLKAES